MHQFWQHSLLVKWYPPKRCLISHPVSFSKNKNDICKICSYQIFLCCLASNILLIYQPEHTLLLILEIILLICNGATTLIRGCEEYGTSTTDCYKHTPATYSNRKQLLSPKCLVNHQGRIVIFPVD